MTERSESKKKRKRANGGKVRKGLVKLTAFAGVLSTLLSVIESDKVPAHSSKKKEKK